MQVWWCAFVAWQKISQVIKTGTCEPIGTYTRKRHLQTVVVHARLRRQLSRLRRLSFDLSWILPGSPVSRVWIARRTQSAGLLKAEAWSGHETTSLHVWAKLRTYATHLGLRLTFMIWIWMGSAPPHQWTAVVIFISYGHNTPHHIQHL